MPNANRYKGMAETPLPEGKLVRLMNAARIGVRNGELVRLGTADHDDGTDAQAAESAK